MTPEKFFARLEEDNRRVAGTHDLEAGLEDADLNWWQKQHPQTSFPEDFIDLLRLHNGFSLHLDEYLPMGAIHLFSIREIKSASRRLYGERRLEGIPKTWLAITYHPDGARYLILDLATNRYLDVDPIATNEAEVVANNVEEMLDWVNRVVKEWLG